MVQTLREHRQQKGWSARDLARAANVSYGTIWRIERMGANPNNQRYHFIPQAKVIGRISNTLGVPSNRIAEFSMTGSNADQQGSGIVSEPEFIIDGDKGIEFAKSVALAALCESPDQMLHLLDQAIVEHNETLIQAVTMIAVVREWIDVVEHYVKLKHQTSTVTP